MDLIEREGARVRQEEIGRHQGWQRKTGGNAFIMLSLLNGMLD